MKVVGSLYLKSVKRGGKTGVGARSASGTSWRKRCTCNRDKASEAELSIPGICTAFKAMLNLAHV